MAQGTSLSICGTLLFIVAASASRVARNSEKLKITTLVEPPYVKENGPGNYEGFIPDMMEKLSDKLDFEYELVKVADGKYGQKKPDGSWNGMIGEVQSGNADVAAAPITISNNRKAAISFTEPFMVIETTLLAKKPEDGKELPFSDAKTLSEQSDIKYGVVKDGMTQNFFKTSQNQVYKKMWNNMQKNPSSLVTSNKEGVEKVRNSDGKYVFIIESVTADYWINKSPCDLQKVSKIDKVEGSTNEYGFALPKSSQWKARFDDAIKEMKDNGEIDALKDKWWKGDCPSSSPIMTSSLSLSILAFFLAKFL